MKKASSLEKTLITGKDWRQEVKGATEDEMVGWHHQFNQHELGQLQEIVKDGEAWRAVLHGVAVLDTTEQLNNNKPLDCQGIPRKVTYMESLEDWYPIRTDANRIWLGTFLRRKCSLISEIYQTLSLYLPCRCMRDASVQTAALSFFLSSDQYHWSILLHFLPFPSLIIE